MPFSLNVAIAHRATGLFKWQGSSVPIIFITAFPGELARVRPATLPPFIRRARSC